MTIFNLSMHRRRVITISLCVCVCSLVIVENALFRFLLNPFAGKNLSPSGKKLWRFLENFLVAKKSQCKALSIGHYLEISLLLLMSAADTIETITFVSLKLCFLGFVHHNELFFSYLSINSQTQVRIRADEKRMPTHCSIIDLRLHGFVYAEVNAQRVTVQSKIFVARVLHFSAFILTVFMRLHCRFRTIIA